MAISAANYDWVASASIYPPEDFAWIDDCFEFKSIQNPGDIDYRAPILFDRQNRKRIKIFYAGGCEFTYVGFFCAQQGHEVVDTFVSGVASDPIAEFVMMNGNHLEGFDADLIVLSCAVPFKQILLKLHRFSRKEAEEAKDDLARLVSGLEQSVQIAKKMAPKARIALLSHPVFSGRIFHLYEEAIFGSYSGDTLTLRDIEKIYALELSRLAREHGILLLDFDEAVSNFGRSAGTPVRPMMRVNEPTSGHPEIGGARVLANVIDGWVQSIWPQQAKIKAIALDLDNTLWTGTIRDDGFDHVKANLREKILNTLARLGDQGILLTICSKNDEAIADKLPEILPPWFMRRIVATRINWLPKSANLLSIIEELNIGADTVAFFDDQEYERAEVAAGAPKVRVFSDADIYQVPRYAPFTPGAPLSKEARSRSESYIAEQSRRKVAAQYNPENFKEFLVSCKFRLNLYLAGVEHAARVAEIFQRTNQQNITLKRTPLEVIRSAILSKECDVWCCELVDRFATYGMIGAIMVRLDAEKRIASIAELAFSCRAMGKGIESAFIKKMVRHYRQQGFVEVAAEIQMTDQNKGMIEIVEKSGLKQKVAGILFCELDRLPIQESYDPWINWVTTSEAQQTSQDLAFAGD